MYFYLPDAALQHQAELLSEARQRRLAASARAATRATEADDQGIRRAIGQKVHAIGRLIEGHARRPMLHHFPTRSA